MKTKQLGKKLTLNKNTISDLNDKEMNALQAGGGTMSCVLTCSPCDTNNQSCYTCISGVTKHPFCVQP